MPLRNARSPTNAIRTTFTRTSTTRIPTGYASRPTTKCSVAISASTGSHRRATSSTVCGIGRIRVMLHGQRVVVVMPAYRAERTLEACYRAIPHDVVDAVLLVDDASDDAT